MQTTRHDPIERATVGGILVALVAIAAWGARPIEMAPAQTTILVVTATPAAAQPVSLPLALPAPTAVPLPPSPTPVPPLPEPVTQPEPVEASAPAPAVEQQEVVYTQAIITPAVPTPQTNFYDTSSLPPPSAQLIATCASELGRKSWICNPEGK